MVLGVWVAQELGNSYLSHSGPEAVLRRGIFFVTTVLAILLAWHFRRFVGAWLIAGGIAMNMVAMAGHGGLMPVAYETIRDSGAFPEITEANIGGQVENSKDVVLWKKDIRFEQLSDRYFVTIPGYGPNIYSAGDFVAFAGVFMAAAQVIIEVVRPRSRKSTEQMTQQEAPQAG